MKKLIAIIICICLALTLIGCESKVTSLKMTLVDSLPVGDTALAKITVDYNTHNLSSQDKEKLLQEIELTWSSSDESVATVNNKGVVTGIAEGTVTIAFFGKSVESKYSSTKEIIITAPVANKE